MISESVVQSNGTAIKASSGVWDAPYRFLTVGLILTIAASAFEQLSVATMMPAAVNDLGGLALYGWVFSAFMLMTVIGLTLGGSEADRVGPLAPFLAGVVLFTLGLMIAGLAPTMPMLIAGRAVQGFGAGLVSAIVYVAIGRGYPAALRPQMLALVSSAYVLPSLIGPALAGVITDGVGWRWVFLGLTPMLPVAAALTVSSMRQFERSNPVPRDWTRVGAAVRLATGAGILMGGLGSQQPLVVVVGLIGLALCLGIPALRQLLPSGSAQGRGLAAALFTAILLNMAFFGMDAFVPLALTMVRQQATTFGGLALTAATLGWTTSAWIQARLARRASRRHLVWLGLGLIIVGIGGTLAVLEPSVPVALALVAWGTAGLGMGFASPMLSLVVLELTPPGQEGAGTSALGLGGLLGIALGAGIGGVIVGHADGGVSVSPLTLALHGLLMIGVAVIAVWFARHLPGRTAAAMTQSEAAAVPVTH